MIIRQVEMKDPYTRIFNDTIRDPQLTWKATGLLVYLLTLPDNWEVHSNHLKDQKKDGRDAVLSGLKELEEVGYMIRRRPRNPDGTYGYETWVRGDLNVPFPPETEKPNWDYPNREMPDYKN